MVKAGDSRPSLQNSAYYFPELNYMSGIFHSGFSPSTVDFLESNDIRTGGIDGTHRSLLFSPPNLENNTSTFVPHLGGQYDALCQGLGTVSATNLNYGPSDRRRLVIFDQSGADTRTFFSPICPLPTLPPVIPPRKSTDAAGDLLQKTQSSQLEQETPMIPPSIFLEKFGDNETELEKSGMHEDTDEINALLYSSDDDCSSDEDEVTSTANSLFWTMGGGNCRKREYDENILADCKRQRLLEGGDHKSSSWMRVACLTDNDAQSRNTDKWNCDEVNFRKFGEKKDNIRETLEALKSIIPYSKKSKDPLSIIEEAISYLKYLKIKAQGVGVSELLALKRCKEGGYNC